VTIRNCSFHSNRASGIVVRSGSQVAIHSSSFQDNGDANINGGAVHIDGGRVWIESTVFRGNTAVKGGALYVGPQASVHIYSCSFVENSATEHGGALYIMGNSTRVAFADRTRLSRNTARRGSTLFLGQDSTAAYVLPAPMGFWVANTQKCVPSVHGDLCSSRVNAMVTLMLPGALDDDFPFICSAGLLGDSYEVSAQNNPQCSGVCPAGYLCSGGTVVPVPCETGTYCDKGSPAPTPCPPGTYGHAPMLKSSEECTPCEPGHWCRSGVQNPCGAGHYNNATHAQSVEECIPCPQYSTTRSKTAVSLSECVCDAGYFDNRLPNGTAGQLDEQVQCQRCFVGTNCSTSELGVTLATLPTRRGYWRPSAYSFDIRECPDVTKNCSTSTTSSSIRLCESTTSGCVGGANFTATCNQGLEGAFCRLCSDNASSDEHYYYVGATIGNTTTAIAHCEPCGEMIVILWTYVGILVFIGVLVVVTFLAFRWACQRSQTLAERGKDCSQALSNLLRATSAANKLKICVGFYMIMSKVEKVYQVSFPPIVSALYSIFSSALSVGSLQLNTPLACFGLGGYFIRLISWMTLAPIVSILICVGLFISLKVKRALTCDAFGERAVFMLVRLLFLFYPIITSIAFEAFACYIFNDPREPEVQKWLITDVKIDCTAEEYDSVTLVATLAVIIYPIGFMCLIAVLLLCCRATILFPKERRKTKPWLAKGLSFLYREYRPECYYWEVMEMLRRFLLVGYAIVVQPGSIFQLGFAIAVSLVFLFAQLRTRPYLVPTDEFLASVSSLMMVVGFTVCIIFQYDSLVEAQQQAGMLSPEQKRIFMVDTWSVGIAVLVSSIVSPLLAGAALILGLMKERRRLKLEKLNSANRRLRFQHNGLEVEIPLHDSHDFHLFLSHVWATGQDQMRVIKQRLLEMCPSLRVFLDVDDLKEIGDLEGYVRRTQTVLVFCSDGYFFSKNCMRELLSSVHLKKEIITVLELDRNKGAMTKGDIKAHLVQAEIRYAQWEMLETFCERGWALPVDQMLYGALFESKPIEWNRIADFQDVTLRLVAERLLPTGHEPTFIAGALKYTGGVTLSPPSIGSWHVYCSKHNLGAAELMRELANQQRLEALAATDQFERLRHCARMLVYLDARTWQSGTMSADFAVEVEAAMDADVPLLLAHEMPGEAQEGRHAIDFDKFFVCESGTTPPNLLKRQIYAKIAISLKGDEWRLPSMVRLAEALGATMVQTRNVVEPKRKRSLSLFRRSRRRTTLSSESSANANKRLSQAEVEVIDPFAETDREESAQSGGGSAGRSLAAARATWTSSRNLTQSPTGISGMWRKSAEKKRTDGVQRISSARYVIRREDSSFLPTFAATARRSDSTPLPFFASAPPLPFFASAPPPENSRPEPSASTEDDHLGDVDISVTPSPAADGGSHEEQAVGPRAAGGEAPLDVNAPNAESPTCVSSYEANDAASSAASSDPESGLAREEAALHAQIRRQLREDPPSVEFVFPDAGPIGVTLNFVQGGVVVAQVDEGSPAFAQGVPVNVPVCRINGKSTTGMDVTAAEELVTTGGRPLRMRVNAAHKSARQTHLPDPIRLDTPHVEDHVEDGEADGWRHVEDHVDDGKPALLAAQEVRLVKSDAVASTSGRAPSAAPAPAPAPARATESVSAAAGGKLGSAPSDQSTPRMPPPPGPVPGSMPRKTARTTPVPTPRTTARTTPSKVPVPAAAASSNAQSGGMYRLDV